MIGQLNSITLENFRVFQGIHSIPLNANVVLIHGENGAGKSSLLHGIELALTGNVSDLIKYSDDYPRCLINVHSNGPAKAALEFVNSDVTQNTSYVVANDLILRESQSLFNENDIRLYCDRCYLSQAKLSRLLEIYQAEDSTTKTPPLVQFIRDLLDLEVTDSVIEGLFDAENIRRIRKSVPQVATLEEVIKDVPTQITETELQLKNCEDLINGVVNEVRNLFALHNNDPIPNGGWDLNGVRERRTAISNQRENTAIREKHRQFGEAEAKLERETFALLQNSPGEISEQLKVIEDSVAKNREVLERAVRECEPLVRQTEQLLSLSLVKDVIRPEELSTTIESVLRSLEHFASSLDAKLKLLDAITSKQTELTNDLNSIQSRLDSVVSTEPILDSSIAIRQLCENALAHVDSNTCPVCSRDFSEVGKEDLRTFLITKLTRVGADIETLQKQATESQALQARKSALIAELQMSTAQREVGEPKESLELSKQRATGLVLDFNRALSEKKRWEGLIQELQKLEDRRRELIFGKTRFENANKSVRAIAAELRIPWDTSLEPSRATDSLRQAIQASIKRFDNSRIAYDETLARLDDLIGRIIERDLVAEKLRALRSKLNFAEIRYSAVKTEIDTFRQIQRTAIRTREAILDRVFNESLNGLWSDLFRRLVPNEVFQPILSQGLLSRRRSKSAIKAIVGKIAEFQAAGSVLSSGNLNTAALSLFLSLHLIQSESHKVLVLDDPVQNMDDVHVVELAGLLRAIVHETRRQIFIAVHEKALFEYLIHELGPTSAGYKLIAINLVRDRDNPSTRTEIEIKNWLPDQIASA